MNETILKPMMRVSDMVKHLEEKNIKFNIVSESDAEEYLRNNNNYYNLLSYKNNFVKVNINGKIIDKYVDLDFAYLKDLAIIDYELRRLLFRMTIDIEHYLKIKILNIIETISIEDGYRIVNKYLEKDYTNEINPQKLHNSILGKMGSEQYQKVFFKYDFNQDKRLENIPIWEFMEIITFGELVNFYEYFIEEYSFDSEIQNIYILRETVKLRNAVAHNNCILSDLGKKDNKNIPPYKIVNYLEECGIGKKVRNNKLANSRIRQITYTLYMFNNIVSSKDVLEVVTEDINKLFFERIILHKEYYNNNELLKSVYSYFEKIIQTSFSKKG